MIFQFHLQMLLSAMLKAVRRRVKPSTAHTFFLLIVIFYPALNPSNLGKDLNLIKSQKSIGFVNYIFMDMEYYGKKCSIYRA